jgi:hypothetical protein
VSRNRSQLKGIAVIIDVFVPDKIIFANATSPLHGEIMAIPARSIERWTALASETIPTSAQAPHCTLVEGIPLVSLSSAIVSSAALAAA